MFLEEAFFALETFLGDPVKAGITLAAIAIAITSLYLFKRADSVGSKVLLAYLHLSALFFPLALFAYSTGCSTAMASCAGNSCASIAALMCSPNLIKLLVYPLPITIALATVAGFVVIPFLHTKSSKVQELKDARLNSFAGKWARRLKLKQPKLYAVDDQKPLAYSFKSFQPSIFLSIGLLELLGLKEKQAVVLHELAHLKEDDSALKVSEKMLKFSPLYLLKEFAKKKPHSPEAEKKADEFAAKAQGTGKHVKSARGKVNEYYEASIRLEEAA